MGFGSYDESEQQDQDVDTDDSDAVSVHKNDHEGDVTFETDASTNDLLDKLDDMQDDGD